MRSAAIKCWLSASLAAVCLVAGAVAQEFPSRPVKIVVGFGPGGVADITARIVAQKMGESIGKQVIVENSPSAGGINAAVSVARAPADGHTLLLVSNQNAVSPSLFKSLPYDPVGDFAMISLFGSFDLVLVADKAAPFKGVPDVIAAARGNPSRFNIGTIAIGSTQHLSAELFKSLANLDVPTVTYKSTGEVVNALKSGSVQVGFEMVPAVGPQIASGNLRPLAVSSSKRIAAMPDVPTIAESGLPGYLASSWNGLAAPAKTPREIVQYLNREVAKAVNAPDAQKRLHEVGINPQAGSPEALKALLESEIVKWRGVIERARIEKQ
jgi:tripartite-type tricarboxylate transporter receptor subunit TctC